MALQRGGNAQFWRRGWVTAGSPPGRELTAADLTVALNGVVVDSPEVALDRHPESEGVYNLVFSAAYWARSLATGYPTVSFAAGTFVSPTLGPLGAFSESVMLVDCTLPTIARALLLQTSRLHPRRAATRAPWVQSRAPPTASGVPLLCSKLSSRSPSSAPTAA